MRPRWTAAFFAVGLSCLAIACFAAVRRSDVAMLPGAGAVAAAALLAAAGLLAAARGWLALLRGAAPAPVLVRDFLLSQVGKYIPGGVWLGVGQVGLAVRAGVPPSRAAGALATFGVCFVAAAGAAAGVAGALPVPGPGAPYGALLAVGLLLPALLHRRWLAAIGQHVARRLGGDPSAVIPGQRRILAGWAWSVAALGCSAAAYAVLLAAIAPGITLPATVSAYLVSWLAGYLAIGLPSGIGAREVALLVLLPAAPGAVLSASLTQRIVHMVVEALLAGGAHIGVARTAPGRGPHLPTLEAPHA